MKRGKDFRDNEGKPIETEAANEIPVLMFVMREQSPGAFVLRLVTNDSIIGDIRAQTSLASFLEDVDRLYADFRQQFRDVLKKDGSGHLN
jgi:hypothetical protein